MPLPAFVAGAPADVRAHWWPFTSATSGFAIFSVEQPDGSRVRALGQLPADSPAGRGAAGRDPIRHAQFGWQVRVNTFSSSTVGPPRNRGVLAAYTTHLFLFAPPKRSSALATECSSPAKQSVIVRHQRHHPGRARVIRESFARVTIADIDSWLRQYSAALTPAACAGVGHDAARWCGEPSIGSPTTSTASVF
jgi:hypothetical protein